MKPAQIILLAVALVAGGLAAFLMTRGGGPVTTETIVTEVVQEAKNQVLVARIPIGVGERLTTEGLEWQDWPEGAIRPEYVTISAMPDAATELNNTVARFEFFPGEPIREAKLVRSDQGYLSAVLSKGMRGVSVGVTAVSSAGGFIVPNDHVDVLLTTQAEAGERSEVILSNVRILALGKRLGEVGASGGTEDPTVPPTQPITFDDSTIATLELTPAQAETLINAATQGQLSLTLRSVADFNDDSVAKSASSSQTVQLIRFGKAQAINAGQPSFIAQTVDAGMSTETATPELPDLSAEPEGAPL